MLLVGEHGTAKTMLVERLAAALGLAFRHYNASLVNYDDLVGIPMPDERGGLRFVGTPGAIWDAEFVFFDEVDRCRPDLQNKLFPIVHERRVAGVGLPRLRHRWAAMNPPSPDDDDEAHRSSGVPRRRAARPRARRPVPVRRPRAGLGRADAGERRAPRRRRERRAGADRAAGARRALPERVRRRSSSARGAGRRLGGRRGRPAPRRRRYA